MPATSRPSHPLLAPVKRWTFGRKAAVVAAVHDGDVSLEDALKAHGITADEFTSWASGQTRKREVLSGVVSMLPKPYWFQSVRPLKSQRDLKIVLVDMFGEQLEITIPAHDGKAIQEALGRALGQIPPPPKVHEFKFPRAVS